jgi:aminoglycoside phosphotransferase (APT) family kinase protein
VRAWRELDPANAEPRAVQRLRPDATALTYRLEGAAPDGRSVLARFLTADDFARQYTVYRRVLPRLPVTKVYCYGSHAEPDGSGWLFLEDFGAAPVTGERAGYRYAVSRWIARVHVESVQVLAAAGLHGSDASDYLDRLHSAVAKIDRHLRTPALPRDERLGLQALIRTLESIADGWAEIEDECVELPRTLVHGGLRSDTVAVTEGATGLEVRVLDWGTAGWGIPAVDLRDVDLGVYREAIRDEWPELRGAALLRMKELGVFFDALTSIDRAASRVPFPWSRRFPPLRLHGPERGATLAERRDIA